MPPMISSRHIFCLGVKDDTGRLFLTDREPYRFKAHSDNRIRRVVQGDTLFSLAGLFFAPLPRACGFWWVIADFQPDPIIDPTLELSCVDIFIPSLRVLTDVILSEQRRKEHG
jgi:hypothetical protein